MYNIDFKKLVTWFLPTWLRYGNVLMLVKALNWPIRQLYNAFIRLVDSTLYRLRHNSQVCYLRAALNDSFDNTPRRIVIEDFDSIDRIYLWADADNRDVNIGITQYLWADNAYADSGVDFTVKVPITIVTTDPEIKRLLAMVNQYKLPGKNYNIVRI